MRARNLARVTKLTRRRLDQRQARLKSTAAPPEIQYVLRQRGIIRVIKAITAGCTIGLALMIACNWRVIHAGVGLARRGGVDGSVRDVAIVPGTTAYQGRPLPMLRARLEGARWALENGRVKAILVSGDEAAGETTVMRAWLERRGVGPSRILVDPSGTRTLDTMENAARRFGISSAVICTQEESMNRALFLARASGIDAVGLITDVTGPRSLRMAGREALKSTLAVVETALMPSPR